VVAVNNLFTPGEGSTTIYYKTETAGNVTIKLYTLDGRPVRTLFDGYAQAGDHYSEWAGSNDDGYTVSSGIYLLHIVAPGFKSTKKICVIR
jgi:flagellar hook assembly protein FlgD